MRSVVWVKAMTGCVLAGLLAGGCRDRDIQSGSPDIAVTNSYLQCVVRDLCGPDTEVLCLAPPGMCPGHFDISPAQVRQLRRCRLLLLFAFQQSIEETLVRLKQDGLATAQVRTPPGLCLPETYRAACRQVCELLSQAYPERAAHFQERLVVIDKRLGDLGTELQRSVAAWDAGSVAVLASNHQVQFAEWLGLETVATFVGRDVETISNIDHCLKQAAGREVRCVIANQQEGTALAQALADRLGAAAVVFSNFPQPAAGEPGFDQLLRDNVRRLTQVARP